VHQHIAQADLQTRHPDCFRAEELADAGDSSLIGPVEQYRLAFAAFDSARARVQLLCPEPVSASVDKMRDAMNNFYTASSEQAFLREEDLSSAIDDFVRHARGTLKS
jgi:hypothetical protein